MNLCPCGARGDPGAECSCSPQRLARVPRQALAGAARPLRPGRADATSPRAELAARPAEPSGPVRQRVEARDGRAAGELRRTGEADVSSTARSSGCRSRGGAARVWPASPGRSRHWAARRGGGRASGRGALVQGSARAFLGVNVRRLRRSEPAFPPLLAAIHDPPAGLWLRGAPEVGILSRPAVAIVGARACSAYGARSPACSAGSSRAAGLVVLSGLARGVDSEAHRGALEAGGTTVAVLGCGIDRDYPAVHRLLAAEIPRQGSWSPSTSRESSLRRGGFQPGTGLSRAWPVQP